MANYKCEICSSQFPSKVLMLEHQIKAHYTNKEIAQREIKEKLTPTEKYQNILAQQIEIAQAQRILRDLEKEENTLPKNMAQPQDFQNLKQTIELINAMKADLKTELREELDAGDKGGIDEFMQYLPILQMIKGNNHQQPQTPQLSPQDIEQKMKENIKNE